MGAGSKGHIRKGYDIYNVKPGDTLYRVAKQYGTTLDSVLAANTGINPLELVEGQEIVVPYGTAIVNAKSGYRYEDMETDIMSLKMRYPFIEYGSAGKSVLGREIYYIRLGTGPNRVFFNGSHHGSEWITSLMLMKFIEDFSYAYSNFNVIKGCNPADIWNRSSIYIIPMVNPDGVDLSIDGIDPWNPYYDRVTAINGGSHDFSRWGANINGVDINHNYDAGWELSKKRERLYNINGPSPNRYSGPYPQSEPETRAIVEFAKSRDFKLSLSYHTCGEIIYWTYGGIKPPNAESIGQVLSNLNGYALSDNSNIVSCAGFKDWFIKEYRLPSYNILAGRGTAPLPVCELDNIYRDNLEVLLIASVI